MSDQVCLICFVSDFPGQKSARFHQTKWKIAKPCAATIGAPFLFERKKRWSGAHIIAVICIYCKRICLKNHLVSSNFTSYADFSIFFFIFGAHQINKKPFNTITINGWMIFPVLTSRQMSQMERHLRMLAKLGLRSTDLLLNTEIQAMLPGGVVRLR